jgi:hypothetical protein
MGQVFEKLGIRCIDVAQALTWPDANHRIRNFLPI